MRRSASSPANSVARNSPVERSSAANPAAFPARATQARKLFSSEPRCASDRRARREHARDLALHQLLGEPRVFHLLADGDLEALANELGNVVFRRVIGHAAHGNGDALFLVARGQRDLQLARGDHRVLEEELVEVAQAEEQQRVGMLFLDRGVLPHQRSGRLAHGRKLRGL